MGEHWAGMIVRYVDGNENRFAFKRAEDEASVVARIEEAVNAGVLMIELEDRLLAIPWHRIKSLEVRPTPPKLPRFAVRNAHLVS